MSYSPIDILKIVKEGDNVADFFSALTKHVENYTIAEITDKEFKILNVKSKENPEKTIQKYKLRSKAYNINVEITDDEIITAMLNKLYISPFISRKDDVYQVHFLVHRYPEAMKSRFEEEIANEVFDYMMLQTIVVLRLDTPEKVRTYMGI